MKIKQHFKTYISELSRKILYKQINSHLKSGKIRKFDDEFYHQFDGMYYGGLPIYYYLMKMNMGRCFDASAVLALAMGKNVKVCRGFLENLKPVYQEDFIHGWVEDDEFVYDTTLQMICKKEVYEELFKPTDVTKTEQSVFFEQCKDLSDWTIRDKIWYEENYTLANLQILSVRRICELKLNQDNLSEKERAFYERVLQDLPDETKAPRPSILTN